MRFYLISSVIIVVVVVLSQIALVPMMEWMGEVSAQFESARTDVEAR